MLLPSRLWMIASGLWLLAVPCLMGGGCSSSATTSRGDASGNQMAAGETRLASTRGSSIGERKATGELTNAKRSETLATKPREQPRHAAGHEGTPQAELPNAYTWRSPDGQILTMGNFVDFVDDQVCVETPEGLGIAIPFGQLCEENQRFVMSQLYAKQSGTADVSGVDFRLSGADPINPDILFDDEVVVEETQFVGGGGREDTAQAEVAGPKAASHDPRKFVIPFDFVSRFDGGRYGQMVAEMIWKKLYREGGFLLPGSMLEVRDFCASHQIRVTPETPLDEVGKVVRQLFEGDVAIWGSVEKAPGTLWDEYDLVIKCVDFSQEPPLVVLDLSARTKAVSEIPHLYAEMLLDKLYDRQPSAPRQPDPIAEENWQKNPNLVIGGDFEQGRGGVPIGWERGGGQHREPLGRLVKWIPEPENPMNRIIRFEFSADVGDTYGVMYYSEPFPVEEGATYRFQCRWRSNGPEVKVFIKCYDLFESEYQPAGVMSAGKSERYVPQERQLREVYRSQQNLKGPLNQWNVHTEDFTPRHTKYTPRWGKVMLYAYLGAGVVDFDDVVLKQILPPSPGESKKKLRHSLASPVTVEEMEENVRRSEESRQKTHREGQR